MSKTLLDAPIYINTYRLAGIVYDLRFVMPKFTLKRVLERKYKVRL